MDIIYEKYSAGVLIYDIFEDGILRFLLGRDNKYNCWSDFGGKCEIGDNQSPVVTASREFYEESSGIILSFFDIKYELLKKSKKLHCVSFKNRPYFMFLMKCPEYVNHSDILINFDNQTTIIKKMHICRKFKEKNTIQWFTYNDIINHKSCMRSVFYNSFVTNWSSIHAYTLLAS